MLTNHLQIDFTRLLERPSRSARMTVAVSPGFATTSLAKGRADEVRSRQIHVSLGMYDAVLSYLPSIPQ